MQHFWARLAFSSTGRSFLLPSVTLLNEDITSHIDFYPLEQIATNQNFTSSTITQRQFLHDFAIKLRLEHLKRQNPSKAIALDGQYNYLTADDKMGSLFKILQIF